MTDFPGKRRFVIVLGCLTAIGAIGIDMSLPSIPQMVAELATTMATGQQIVGIFVAGVALGQLPAGLVSDRIGRMPVILTGVGVFTAAGLVTMVADDMALMLAARFAQGIGASVGIVISRAVVRDIASGREAARLLSMMLMIFTAGPMLAPVAGSYLVAAFGWRAPFTAITLIGALLFVSVFSWLHETRQPDREHRLGRQLVLSLQEFLRHRQSILGLLFVVSAAMGFMSLIAGSSALIVDIYGYPVHQFGFIFAIAGFAILLGSSLNRRLLARFNSVQLAGVGAFLIGAAGAQLLLMTWLGEAPFGWLWGNVCLYMGGVGLLLPNATALALDPVPRIAGTAASIIGTMQNLAASVSAAVTGLLYDGTMPNSILIIGAFGLVTFGLFLLRALVLGGRPLHVPGE